MKQLLNYRLRTWFVSLIGVIPFIVMSLGCDRSSEQRLVAQGTVTYQGDSIDEGTISFIPLESSANKTLDAEIVDGHYAVSTDAPNVIGRYRVEIQAYKPTGKEVPNLLSPDRKKSSRGTTQEKKPFLPERFNTNSELVAEISSENSTLDFTL